MKKQISFSIEEILGDIITYDVVMEINGVKKVLFPDCDSIELAQIGIDSIKELGVEQMVRSFGYLK